MHNILSFILFFDRHYMNLEKEDHKFGLKVGKIKGKSGEVYSKDMMKDPHNSNYC